MGRGSARGSEHSTPLGAAVEAMLLACELRDPYTANHCRRVARLSVTIGRALGLTSGRLEALRLGAMMHDIGKLHVPMAILNKVERLTAEELEIVQSHPEAGGRVVHPMAHQTVEDIIVQHHERLDGSGYPAALAGQQICLESCIVSVADVFDSMAFDRPYRVGLGAAAALAELISGRGRLYASPVVAACEGLAHLDRLGA